MKKRSILTLLTWACFFVPSFSQYLTLTDSNAVWSVQQWKFFSIGDTMIASNNYIKITEGALPGFTVPLSPVSHFIRSEPNGKNYFRSGGVDYLLFDLSLNVGDTGTVYMTPGTGNPGHFIVDSTDVIFMAGANRKFVYVHSPIYQGRETWVEGIGTLNGFDLANYCLTGLIIDFFCWNDPFLLCYHENGVKLFQSSDTPWNPDMHMVDSCYWMCTMGLDGDEPSIFTVYPNPTSDFITISGLEDTYVCTIINSFGQEIRSETLSVTNSKVDVSALSPGIYFLVITHLQTKKKTVLKFSKMD